MTTPQIFFVVSSLSGALYFLFKKRAFDYFSVAYFGALIYFMPGFFGYTAYHVWGDWRQAEINSEAYWIMIFVTMSILVCAWIASFFKNPISFHSKLSMESWVPCVLSIFAVIGFFALLITSGSGLFQKEKILVMESLNRWHILFYVASTIGLPVSIINKRLFFSFLFLGFLSFNLFIGFRFPLAIGIISTFVVFLSIKNKQRLIVDSRKIILLAFLFGFFMFFYKVVSYALRAGMLDVAVEILLEGKTFSYMITNSEPFLVQQTMNDIVGDGFKTNLDHIFSSIYQLLLFAPELGAEHVTFNELFQPVLYPHVEYGLAANIWAQMWSGGGWPLLASFVLFFNVFLSIGNATLRAKSTTLRAGMAPVFCCWAFYIHRNELGYALNLEKRWLLLFFLVVVILSVVKSATRHRRGCQGV